MIKPKWVRVREISDTTFLFLVVALTFILLVDRFADVHQFVNMDYLLAIILLIGFFSILLRSK